jgi:hypothetical protein
MSKFTDKFKKCQQPKRCPHPIGVWSGRSSDGHTVRAGTIPCNGWDCEVCGPRKKGKLFKRVLQGQISETVKSKYALKFGTFTFGGNEKRYGSDPVSAYEEMAVALHKMIRALKKRDGHFHYFKVCEAHQDGWPHFHILFAGDNIAPISFLESATKLWCELYGLGFIRINCKRFNDKKHAINYLLKYITKDIKPLAKYKRIFSASHGALVRVVKPVWQEMLSYVGPGCKDFPGWNHDAHDFIQIADDGHPWFLGEQMLVNMGDRVTDMQTHLNRMMHCYFSMMAPVRPSGVRAVY